MMALMVNSVMMVAKRGEEVEEGWCCVVVMEAQRR